MSAVRAVISLDQSTQIWIFSVPRVKMDASVSIKSILYAETLSCDQAEA